MSAMLKHRAGNALLIIAVCVLAAGAVAFAYARSAHDGAQLAVLAADAEMAQTRLRQARADGNRALLTAAEKLQQQADAAGTSPQGWSERHVNVRQQNLQRSEVNQILAGTARHAGQVMKLEEFELSVTQPDEGLFEMPKTSRQPVLLTLRGMMYFRLGQ